MSFDLYPSGQEPGKIRITVYEFSMFPETVRPTPCYGLCELLFSCFGERVAPLSFVYTRKNSFAVCA